MEFFHVMRMNFVLYEIQSARGSSEIEISF